MSLKFKWTGETVIYRNQRYTVCGFELYQTRTGALTELAEVATHCAVCGAPMTFKVGAETCVYLRRRCDVHKRPGQKVPLSKVHPKAQGLFV